MQGAEAAIKNGNPVSSLKFCIKPGLSRCVNREQPNLSRVRYAAFEHDAVQQTKLLHAAVTNLTALYQQAQP